MEILADKVIYEHMVKALEEERKRNQERDRVLTILADANSRKDDRIKELEDQLEDVWTRFDEVESKQTPQMSLQAMGSAVGNNNNVKNITNNNNNTNNNTVNNTANINIILCDFDNPCLDGLSLTPEDLVEASKEKSLLDYNFKRIYFNPKAPRNHVMYCSNKKTHDVVVFKSGFWSLRTGNGSRDTVRSALLCVDNFTHRMVDKYAYPDAIFDALPPQAQVVIKEFNKRTTNTPPGTRVEDIFPLDDIYDLILSGREIVKPTILESGCKLIK
jgi:hypothetical protein